MLLQSYKFLLMLIWIINAEKIAPIIGNKKLNLQFDNVAFMDSVSRESMRLMHDDLDTDEDGNVSKTEGKVFLEKQKEMRESSEKNANLAGFATDTDGRISEQEFWDSWIHSDVRNWSNAEMLTWLKYDVELPQYTSTFHALNISGSAFPVLASNGSLVSALVEGSKENRLKLMLKAKEIVLFGPSKERDSFLKDALLTISLLLALSGLFFGVHVQRNANRTIESIQEKMKALQQSMETIAEVESEMEKIWAHDVQGQDDDRSRGSNSGESEDSISLADDAMMSTRLAEVLRELDATKEALRRAQKQIERKACELPAGLLELLQVTYEVESKFVKIQKDKVYRDVEQTKSQFKKMERHRSTFFGILQVVHSRQMDGFDFHIQQTKDEFKELQVVMKERRKRWEKIQQLCKFRIKQSSGSRNGTSSRQKLSPEEELRPGLEPGSITSSSTLAKGDWDISHPQKNAGGGNKRPTLLTSPDDESHDTASLQSFSGRRSHASSERRGNLPSHVSAPSLSSSYANQEKARTPSGTKTIIPHSESAARLSSFLSVPETGNQTFPKRSPASKRRAKLLDSAISNGGFTLTSHEDSRLALETSHGETKSEAAGNGRLNGSRRSPSAQSLSGVQKDHEFAEPSAAIERTCHGVNGVVHPAAHYQAGAKREEKERKSNVVKRLLRLGKDKKR